METKEIQLFFDAVYKNDIEKVKELLDSGIDVNYKSEHGTALDIANYNDLEEIFKLLLNHPNLEIRKKHYWEYGEFWAEDYSTSLLLLHFSCDRKDVEAVKLLLYKFNIDPNIKGYDGRVPLHRACRQNNVEVVKLLLAHPKIDINAKDIHDCTPLFHACLYNSIESLSILLEQPDIEINPNYERDKEIKIEEIEWELSPLFTACEEGYTEIVEMLLNRPEIEINFNCSVFSDNREVFNLLQNHLKSKELKYRVINHSVNKK